MIMVRRRWTIGEVVQRLLGGAESRPRERATQAQDICSHPAGRRVLSNDESVALSIRTPLANETFRVVETCP